MLTKYFLTRFQPHIIGVVATLGSAHSDLPGNFYRHWDLLQRSDGKHLVTSPRRLGGLSEPQPTLPHVACCGDLLLCFHAPRGLSNQCNRLQSFRDEVVENGLLRCWPQPDHPCSLGDRSLHVRLPSPRDARVPDLGEHHKLLHCRRLVPVNIFSHLALLSSGL